MATKQQMDACINVLLLVNDINMQNDGRLYFHANFLGGIDGFSVYGYESQVDGTPQYIKGWSACDHMVYLGYWYLKHEYDSNKAIALLDEIYSELQNFLVADADGVPL